MKKSIISFLTISLFSAALAFADLNTTGEGSFVETNSSAPEANLTLENNKTEIKKEVAKILSKSLGAEDGNKTEVINMIAEKVAKTETSQKKSASDVTLISVVNEIKKLNLQKNSLLASGDKNASKNELDAIERNKAKLFDRLPFAITQQDMDIEAVMSYAENKKSIQSTLKRYAKRQNSPEYINASADLEKMEMSEIFYTSLMKIENMFVNGANRSELESELSGTILNLQTRDFSKLADLKNNLSNQEQVDALDAKITDLKNDKQTYDEVLEYLARNSDLLATNVVFTSLNFKSVIDYINDKIPFKLSHVNFGKLILITLITLFFYSLRRLLANIIYFVFKFFNKSFSLDSETLKTQVVGIIKRPMGILLIAYSVDICLSIFYYPAPVPIKFANLFSIVYVVLWAWLIIEIIDGYGIVVLGNITKKGVRKDIINLVVKILYVIVIIIAVLLVLKRLGFDISALMASLGIGGLAIAFATKDIIANFFSSVMLLFDNSFSQGDWVVLGDIEGNVVETGFRKTTIRTFDNALVFVPNSNIMAQNIKNWSRRKVGRNLKLTVGVEYGASTAQLRKCVNDIKEMLKSHPGIAQSADTALNSKDFRMRYRQNMVSIDDLAGYKSTMFVALDSFGDSSINILVYCFTKTVIWANFIQTKEDVLFKIMEIVEQNGLSFAFPSQSVYIENIPEIASECVKSKVNSNDRGEQNG
ncbi:mechanosensitive ion channel family protein [uncultured Campylobacter sp.]|uniref:mechanosensitive ion channel family protein n=1 Tax=uncultured Campylobacter sp. TaxID=218934 RepID=UPI0026152B34|nr:mechanosensitive ion channel family protein [uncultured Campylobacter sp.]